MSEHHFPRKRFGQHFLHDTAVLNNIAHALHPAPEETIVEIGPGLGALTNVVLPLVDHLYLIEIDRDLAQKMVEMHKEKITLYQQDALQFDFQTLFAKENKPLRIFGNLPYNISTPLLFHLLRYSHCIRDMLFMLQKEVVDRMVAAPSSPAYGRLSVMIQYACQTTALFDVPPSAFSPPPKVISSIIRLIPYQGNAPHPLATHYENFALVVRTAFQHRRKTLRNTLRELISPDMFAQTNIDAQRRPETLTVTEFVTLSNLIPTE